MNSEQYDTDKKIRAYQVEQLYIRFPLVGRLSFIIFTVLVVVQWPLINHLILILWWGVMNALTVVRLFLVLLFRRAKPSPENIEPWAKRFLIGVICSALGWGAAGIFLFPDNQLAHQLVLALIIAGMASSGVVTLSPLREAVVVFLCLTLIPPALNLLFIGSKIYLIICGLIMLYLNGLILTSRHMTNTIKELLVLRIKSMEQAVKLQESEERYRDLFENATDLIQSSTPEGRLMYVNQAWRETLGYSEEEVSGMTFFDVIHPGVQAHFKESLDRLRSGEKIGKVETAFVSKNGEKIVVEGSVSFRFKEGRPFSIRGIFHDVTEGKRAEEQIKASLAEKEVLLKEIHHRVKNNLQIISSLLNLQSAHIKDKKTLDIFKNSQERVLAMALIHEKMYQSKDLARINIGEYINSLINSLFNSYHLKPGQVQLKMKIEEVSLNIESAIPLGLIMNELVSNSLKHAFPNAEEGELQINLKESNEKEYDYTLIIRDTGVGFPDSLDFHDSGSLGMLLVNSLVKKLKGVIDLDRKKGTTFTIKFKKLE